MLRKRRAGRSVLLDRSIQINKHLNDVTRPCGAAGNVTSLHETAVAPAGHSLRYRGGIDIGLFVVLMALVPHNRYLEANTVAKAIIAPLAFSCTSTSLFPMVNVIISARNSCGMLRCSLSIWRIPPRGSICWLDASHYAHRQAVSLSTY